MPETLIESSSFTTDIVVPIGTDKRKALTVRTPFSGLTNRTKYLYDAATAAAASITALGGSVSGALAAIAAVIDGTTRARQARFFAVTSTQTVTIADGNRFSGSALAASIILTFSDTGAADGDEIVFFNDNPTYEISLNMPAGTTHSGTAALFHSMQGVPGEYVSLTFVRHAGVWKASDAFRLPI